MQPFYVPDGDGRFVSTRSTAGPWGPDSQHGGPPAALLTRAIESLVGHTNGEGPDRVVGRLTVERPRVPLVEGEPTSAVQRLMVCVDSASGVSAALDISTWAFQNTELTVHVLRPPEGEWLCLSAATMLSSGSVGLATSDVYDERGLVARSAQALLVARRRTDERTLR